MGTGVGNKLLAARLETKRVVKLQSGCTPIDPDERASVLDDMIQASFRHHPPNAFPAGIFNYRNPAHAPSCQILFTRWWFMADGCNSDQLIA